MNSARILGQLSKHLILLSLLVAVSYFVVAVSSEYLSIPPGFTNPIWPSAGVALVYALGYGNRALPGVFLGAMGYSLYASLDYGIDATAMISALLVSLGICLQVYVSRKLIFPFLAKTQVLLRERDIFRLLMWAGPISCLISASVATLTFGGISMLSLEDAPRHWFTWWVGDSIGVLIILPLYLLLLYSGNKYKAVQSLRIVGPYFFLFLLIMAMFDFARSIEFEKSERRIVQQSKLFTLAINTHIKNMANSVQGLHALTQTRDKLQYREFKLYAEGIAPAYPSLRALEWIPRVELNGRAMVEDQLRAIDQASIGITERNHRGQLVPADMREEYLPVVFVSPLESNKQALGYDLASQATRKAALTTAAQTGKAIATGRIQLVQEQEGNKRYGFLLMKPVYSTVDQVSVTKGFVLGVFDIDTLVEGALKGLNSGSYEVELVDITHPDNPEWLYGRSEQTLDDVVYQQEIEIGSRTWALKIKPPHSLLVAEQHWGIWLGLIGGLLLLSLTGVYLLTVHGKSTAIRRQVINKTRELKVAKNSAESANRAKSNFLASMSHELRTPLNSIIGFTKRILTRAGEDFDPRTRDALEIVHQNGLHLLSLITDILDLSKIEAGKMEIHCDVVSLEDVTQQLNQQLSTLIPVDKDQEIIINLNTEACFADRKRLLQILINLLSNAIKYSKEGAITLTIDAESWKGRPGIQFIVEDHGNGIKAEDIPKLFQKFSQIDKETGSNIEGTGLGLVMVKELVELHKGMVTVDSVWQQGSTFSFWLPNNH